MSSASIIYNELHGKQFDAKLAVQCVNAIHSAIENDRRERLECFVNGHNEFAVSVHIEYLERIAMGFISGGKTPRKCLLFMRKAIEIAPLTANEYVSTLYRFAINATFAKDQSDHIATAGYVAMRIRQRSSMGDQYEPWHDRTLSLPLRTRLVPNPIVVMMIALGMRYVFPINSNSTGRELITRLRAKRHDAVLESVIESMLSIVKNAHDADYDRAQRLYDSMAVARELAHE